jgi:hypothetical protein
MIFDTITQSLLQWIISYILAPISLIIIIILAVIKWRESKTNPYNIVLSLFFIFLILGLIANVIYALLVNKTEPVVYLFFARLSAFLFGISMLFPLFFLIALRVSFIGLSKAFKGGFFLIGFLLFVPTLFLGNIYLDENFVVRWDLALALYDIIVMAFLLGILFFLSYKIWILFETPEIKRRFLAFLLGYLLISWMMIAVVLVKLDLIISEISSISLGIGMLFAPYMIYIGIGKRK